MWVSGRMTFRKLQYSAPDRSSGFFMLCIHKTCTPEVWVSVRRSRENVVLRDACRWRGIMSRGGNKKLLVRNCPDRDISRDKPFGAPKPLAVHRRQVFSGVIFPCTASFGPWMVDGGKVGEPFPPSLVVQRTCSASGMCVG